MGGSLDPLLSLSRRAFLRLGAIAAGSSVLGGSWGCSSLALNEGRGFIDGFPGQEIHDATLVELQQGLSTGRWTSHEVTVGYLERIQAIDGSGPTLRSILEINPDAMDQAAALDLERSEGRVRGPLHGIPILLKDTIGTGDRMTTTAGSLAMEGSISPEDSEVARRLREAGAILLGKTNLSEWSGFRSSRAVSGWSARGGQTLSPFALDRNPGGSSSGSAVAVAAGLAPASLAVGTNGSITFPASANGLVGIRPTVGLVSRRGIIPVSNTRDTPGPMARTVEDVAILLGVLAGIDPGDPRTAMAEEQIRPDYTAFLDTEGLKGMRIGVVRQFMGVDFEVDLLMDQAQRQLIHQGAVLVDPVFIPHLDQLAVPFAEMLFFELKANLNLYLDMLGERAPVRNLAEIIDFNTRNRDREMPHFGQDVFWEALERGPLTDPVYEKHRADVRLFSRMEGIDWIMDREGLDALVAPGSRRAWLLNPAAPDPLGGGSSGPAALAGYPSVTVPMGTAGGLPAGINFFGRAWSEPVLLRMAYAYEQATHFGAHPAFLPSLDH